MRYELNCEYSSWLVKACLALLVWAASAAAQSGGGHDLSWNVIAGGGSKSRDGTGLYSLRGTVGQPTAGVMTGGVYTITGGFWAIPPQRPADVDGDGAVDVSDLLWLVYSFGTLEGDPGFNADCDFNDDGSVDVSDLLILVKNFGT
jgi:hypothetical protein